MACTLLSIKKILQLAWKKKLEYTEKGCMGVAVSRTGVFSFFWCPSVLLFFLGVFRDDQR